MTTLVALLTVRKEALEAFRAYETHAALVMSDYGGRIERTVVIRPENTPDVVIEAHVLTFPDAEALAAYRRDGRIGQLEHLRKQSVVRTELYTGEDGPEYFVPAIRGAGQRPGTRPEAAGDAPRTPDPGLSFGVQRAIRENRKLEAIRLLRAERGIELLEAKRIVDEQFEAHRQTYGPPPPRMDSGYGRLAWLAVAFAVVIAIAWLLA